MRENLLVSTVQHIYTHVMRTPVANHRVHATHGAPQPFRLLAVMAHPDDEALCVGGTLARYAAQGVAVYLVVATRGERGWRGGADDNPGLERVGQLREAEVRAAAKILGVRETLFLDAVDGELSDADCKQVTGRIVRVLRRVCPEVVITFDGHGMYGHPDHIAISQLTQAAIVCAADAKYKSARSTVPHRVQKLYQRVFCADALSTYQRVFGTLQMTIDGVQREAVPWQDWAITARIEIAPYALQVWNAIASHRTQIAGDETMRGLYLRELAWRTEEYFRAFSMVNGGQGTETDLFAGIVPACETVQPAREHVPIF